MRFRSALRMPAATAFLMMKYATTDTTTIPTTYLLTATMAITDSLPMG